MSIVRSLSNLSANFSNNPHILLFFKCKVEAPKLTDILVLKPPRMTSTLLAQLSNYNKYYKIQQLKTKADSKTYRRVCFVCDQYLPFKKCVCSGSNLDLLGVAGLSFHTEVWHRHAFFLTGCKPAHLKFIFQIHMYRHVVFFSETISGPASKYLV